MKEPDKISTFSERFTQLLDERNMKVIDVAKETGLVNATLSRYKAGKFLPKEDVLNQLAKYFNVSNAWLSGYNVPRNRVMVNEINLPYKEIASYWIKHEATKSEIIEFISMAAKALNED